VESVSWHDVQDFLRKLNDRETDGAWVYRLPRETEWEHSCRGADGSEANGSFDYYLVHPTNDLCSYQANFDGGYPAGRAARGPALERPTKVGSYKVNGLGLGDMHGNVWEWCEDSQGDCSFHATRGGSWEDRASDCRAASHRRLAPSDRYSTVGF